jgi:hypothetical protein
MNDDCTGDALGYGFPVDTGWAFDSTLVDKVSFVGLRLAV